MQCYYTLRWDFNYLLITLFIFALLKTLQLKSVILRTIKYQLNQNHCQISSIIIGF